MLKSYMALGAQVPSSPSSVILLLLCQNYKEYTWRCSLKNRLLSWAYTLLHRRSNQRSRSYLFQCFCLVYMIKMRFAWWTDGAWSLARAMPNTDQMSFPSNLFFHKEHQAIYVMHNPAYYFFLWHWSLWIMFYPWGFIQKITECKTLSIYNVYNIMNYICSSFIFLLKDYFSSALQLEARASCIPVINHFFILKVK